MCITVNDVQLLLIADS